ncbi:MAG TPA: hypothetical protein IAB05_00970 [Candidatus Stercoripulliclostridium merdigallinarum]|uniref:Tubby C 2 family protein n=1 Tax=Candidatus Stercoripulliclostridium merdigallinarum TaxID=2840951 RepID=A0A9D1MGM6_9FIRM|nr:hypothetical protein [Candidatus Stercoripulliclostridium merdigallinarum]
MAKYRIRQKYFALKDRFAVNDMYDNPRYYCDTRLISVPKKFWLENAEGRKIYLAKFKLFSPFRKIVYIYRGEDTSDGYVAKVKRNIRFFFNHLKVTSEAYGDYYIVGHKFKAVIHEGSKDGPVVATLEKHFFKVADTYDIDIKCRYEALMLVLAIIYDYKYNEKH